MNGAEVSAGEILILGAEGMLGHALQLVLPQAIALGREFDITDRERVDRILDKVRPAIVLNAAAFSDVDACEEDSERAFRVNGEAPGFIAAACRRVDAVLVHYSCPDIFDGNMEGYEEESTPAPLNTYGASKAKGEARVMEEMEDFRIIRTSWLYGPFGRNLVDSFLDQAATGPVSASDAYFGSPTFTIDLALGTTGIILARPGIYHLTNDGVCSLYELAHAITPRATVGDVAFGKVRRPRYAVLINTKTDPLRSWQEALAAYQAAQDIPSRPFRE